MDVQLKDGRILEFPEGTRQEDILLFIEKNFPQELHEEPNVAQRFMGHALIGAGDLFNKVGNLADRFGAPEDVGEVSRGMGELFEMRPMARQVAAYPETSMLGKVAGGIAEFVPQIPLYATGEAAALGVMSRLPGLAKVATKLAPVAGEGIVPETARAVGRAAVAGGTVGTLAGTPAGTPLPEMLKEGASEAVGFAGATAVLHPAFKALGYMGRGLYRRYRDMGKVKEELEKRAENDPKAAEELQNIRAAEEEELYVPKGEEETIVPPTKEAQGVLNLEEIAGPEQMARFSELGYTEADLRGLPDKELELILEQGIKKPVVPLAKEEAKEAVSDQTNETRLQGRKRRRKESEQGGPVEGAGGKEAAASGDVQAHEGEAEAKAGEGVDEKGYGYNLSKERDDILREQIEKEIMLSIPEDLRYFPRKESDIYTDMEARLKKLEEEGIDSETANNHPSIRPLWNEIDRRKDIDDLVSNTLRDITDPSAIWYRGSTERELIPKDREGIYFTNNPNIAAVYPLQKQGRRTRVGAYKVSITNPLIKVHGTAYFDKESKDALIKQGYDSAIGLNNDGTIHELVVFDSSKVTRVPYPEEGKVPGADVEYRQPIKDATDILTLQRLGYSAREIKAMSPEEAKATIERVKSYQPTPEELEKAEAAAKQIQEAMLAREQARATAVEEADREAARAKGIAEADAIISDIEAKQEEPLTRLSEVLIKADTIDDPTLDALINNLPKTRDEILLERRRLIEERVRAKKGETAPVEGEKKQPPQTWEELQKHLAEVRAKARRTRKTIDYAAEAKKWEDKLAEEGMGEGEVEPRELSFEEDEPGGTFLGMGPGQFMYNWLKQLGAAERTKENAPSRRIISEVSGSTLSLRPGSEQTESVMKRISENIGAVRRSKLNTPEFAYRNNPKMEPLIFNLHKASFEGREKASNQAATATAARSLLKTEEQEKHIKGIIEGTYKSTDPAEIEAAKMIQEELAASREMIKDAKRQSFRDNLNEDENAAISEVLAGKPIDEVIAKYKTHIVPDKLGRRRVRDWVDADVIRDAVKDYQAIDSWGLDNYVTHFELGDLKIVSGGKLYARATSLEDAARKHIGLVERDQAAGIKRDYQLDTNYNIEPLATGLSKRSYNRLVTNLQKGIADNIEGINSAMARRLAQKGIKDRFFITPTKKFSPFLEERNDLLQGEENIFDTIFHYFYSTNMKMALDPQIDAIRKATTRQDIVGTEQYKAKDGTTKTREIKKPYLNTEESSMIQRLVEDVKGRYYPMDKLVDDLLAGTGQKRLYSKTVARARELQANLKLGYKPVGGLINYTSAIGYLWTKAGVDNIKAGVEFMKTPEGKAFTAATDKYLGVNVVEAATGEISSKGFFEKIGWLRPPETELGKMVHAAIEPTGWFQMGEIPARRLTMATNYLMAKRSGLSEAAARDAAIKATWFTQFTYDMASLPEIMRGPTGRLIFQFKPYMLKAMEFMATLTPGEWVRYMSMQLALAGPRGLTIMLKSLPIIGAVAGWDKIEEWMNKEYPKLSRGVGGFIGVDVSAPATFALPQTQKDWIGPTLSNLVSVYKDLYTPLVQGKGPDGTDIRTFMGSTFPITRYWGAIIDQAIDKDGWVKDERGRRLWQIDSMPSYVVKNMAGAEPLELNRIRTEERILTRRSKDIAEQKTETIDNVLDSIAKGEQIDKDDMEKMQKLGIQIGTLRRAAQFRLLDPKQRRLLQTEIIRRPEILEMYPDSGDLQ